jgi:hypothetical protein
MTKKTDNKSLYLDEDWETFVSSVEGKQVMDSWKQDKDGKWVKAEPGHVVKEIGSGYQAGANNTTAGKAATAWCKHAGDWAFSSIDGIDFYGATGYDADITGMDVVFDLARSSGPSDSPAIAVGKRSTQFIISGPLELNSLLIKPPVFVDMVWPDFSAPFCAGYEFWSGLVKYIREQGHTNVMASCRGGNGRTGSFLAIMLGLMNGVNGEAAIEQIRTSYCKHAIETPTQEQYIVDIVSGKY